MSFSYKKLAVAALVALSPSLVFASLFSSDPAASLITKLSQNQVTIVKEFDAIGNLKGFVVAPKTNTQQQTIVYADKSGQYMVAGAVITPDGQNLSQTDFDKYVNANMAPKIFAAAQKTNWVEEGNPKAPHKAYILVEPNCIACHMLYQAVAPMIKSGQLSVRWIFVAFLKPNSQGMAAAILAAKDPVAAIVQDETVYDTAHEQGGVKPLAKIPPAIANKLQQNMAFMTTYHFVGTPAIVYKTSTGSYNVVRGFAQGKQLQDLVNSMGSAF